MKALINQKVEQNIHRGGMLLSVIIPSHNAEKTLRRAVESAVRAVRVIGEDVTLSSRGNGAPGETGSRFEILVIENTSEDGTADLGRTLEAENPGLVRFMQSEEGVSCARNRGLDEAKGEWILFLDSDDYLLDDAGAVLRDDLHYSGTDLIVHSYESGDRTIHLCAAAGERYSGADVTDLCVRMIENPTRYTSVWSKLFRRARIEYGRLRFDPALRLSEDSHFLIRYLMLCRRIRLLDKPLYHYSTDNASAVRTWDGRKEEGYRNSLLAVQAFMKTQPEMIQSAFAGYGMMQFNLLMVREVFSGKSPYSWRQKISRMKEIAAEEPFAAAIRGYDPNRHKGSRYLPFRLLRAGIYAGAAGIYQGRVLQNARKEKMH